MRPNRIFRLPSWTVRLRLTLLYSGLFLVFGAALLTASYLIFRSTTGVDLIVPTGTTHPGASHGAPPDPAALRQVRQMFEAALRRNNDEFHRGLIESGIAFGIMAIFSVALGWLVAGRVLRPLRTITATTRQISERNLDERLALSGPHDELKDLADTVDGLLARLQAHVAEQQRFAANASHELRTPLALTKTLLEVAQGEHQPINRELIDRLQTVNARAIDLTEALLMLSRADQKTFTRQEVDLSLVAEEAIETLLPLAEEHRVKVETSAEPALTSGSHPLLLQMATNLVHNAIVHNLAEGGSVRITTNADRGVTVLAVESTGERLDPQLISTLCEPFQRGAQRIRTDHAGVGLGLAIVRSITQAHDGTLTLTPRAAGGLRAAVQLPAAPRARADTSSDERPGEPRGGKRGSTSAGPPLRAQLE